MGSFCKCQNLFLTIKNIDYFLDMPWLQIQKPWFSTNRKTHQQLIYENLDSMYINTFSKQKKLISHVPENSSQAPNLKQTPLILKQSPFLKCSKSFQVLSSRPSFYSINPLQVLSSMLIKHSAWPFILTCIGRKSQKNLRVIL